MAKALLLSMMMALILLPLWAARDKNARRGLRKALLFMMVFNLFYLFAVRFIYPRLV